MVMEWCVNEEKDEWVAFLSERIPAQLDDCIKECHLASLDKSIKMMGEEEIYNCLPMLLPKTNNLVHHGFTLRGISKCPVDEWMKEGKPVMTAMKWVLLVRMAASKDLDNLADVFHAADALAKKGLPEVGY